MLKPSKWLAFIFLFSSMSLQADSLQLIVKYKKNPSNPSILQSQLSRLTGMAVTSMTAMAGGAYVIRLPAVETNLPREEENKRINSILMKLRANPEIIYALEDRKGYFRPLPIIDKPISNDVLSHATQWDEFARPAGVMLESAPGRQDGAWAHTHGYSAVPVVVAVLDTGIAPHDHLLANLLKDANGNLWGWNFSANNNDLRDETGSFHGTHVSGTIAGYGNVMSGIGTELKILPIKIPAASGMFYESAVINGIYWAVGADIPGVPHNPYPAKVLNMSFGVDAHPGKEIDHCDEALQEAVFFAREQGAVLIAAAGNDNRWEHYNAPAVCNGVVKVASTGPKGTRAYYSNYGPGVAFAAPGGDMRYGTTGGILSTVNPGGGYQNSGFNFYQGTSMASPHAAGVAGLVQAVSKWPLSAQSVEQILYASTHDFGAIDDPQYSCVGQKPCGHGILDAENAVKTALKGFDWLFSAPTIDTGRSIACGKSRLKPAQHTLDYQGARWILLRSACERDTHLHHPHIRQNDAGQIYAEYGAIVYQLEQTPFQQCEIVGYDGVGCYS